MSLPSVSMIATCKGRLHHLQQALPTWLDQDYAGEWEIVIVDYDCPDGTADWLDSLHDPRIRAVRVRDNSQPFHMNHARNIGATCARGEVFAFIDADNLPTPEYMTTAIDEMRSLGDGLCNPTTHEGGQFGCCLIDATSFRLLNGYDEAFESYGFCDIDIYNRFKARWPGCSCEIPATLIAAIEHSDEDRMRYYSEKNVEVSARANLDRSRDHSRIVNRHGWGRSSACQMGDSPRAISDLRSRHPWPDVRPDLPFNAHGWLGEGNRRALLSMLSGINPRCILEVGSWLGLSARYMLDHSTAHVVCVDAWSHEIVGPRMLGEAGLSDERTLWDQFIANNWDQRDRLTPIRAGTVAGIWLARNAGLSPEIIYIDASHQRKHFEDDLSAAVQCFPRAIICGDDWNWGGPDNHTIRPAVTALVDARWQTVITDGEFWAIR